jgi:hypothetical protein
VYVCVCVFVVDGKVRFDFAQAVEEGRRGRRGRRMMGWGREGLNTTRIVRSGCLLWYQDSSGAAALIRVFI